jgi:hypothetical protein
MGALVLMLMLMVSGAQSTVQQAAQEMQEQFEWEESKIQLVSHGLKEKLDQGAIELEKKRLNLQNLEQHIHDLTKELEQLEQQTQLAAQSQDTQDEAVQERQKQISELERQLADAKSQLQSNLDDPKGDKPIFAIIPYDGPNGTHRRPIYLECNHHGLVIQPEGIVLSLSDLKPPYGPGNPLDAALRTIRAEYPSTSGSVTSNPYPLLVVRPSGIRHYMLARAAMSGWDDQFGYELISEDLELTFPPSLPRLKEKTLLALERARQRQAALILAMPQHYDPQQLSLDDGSDGQHSFGGRHSDPASDWPPGQDSADNAMAGARSGVSLPGYSSTDSRTGSMGSSGSQASSGFASGGSPGSDALASRGSTGQDQTSFGSGSNSSGGGNNQLLAGAGSPENGLRDSNSRGGQAGADYDPAMDTDASTSSSLNGTTGGGGTSGGSGASGQATANAANGNGASGNSAATMQSASGSSVSLPTPGANTNLSVTSGMDSANSGSTGGQADCPNCDVQNMDDPSGMSAPSVQMNLSNQRAEQARPVAQTRGANWAWRGPSRTQTAVVRSIRMRCYVDRWELLPDNGSVGRPEIITFDGTPADRASQLAAAVGRRVESWGVALAGGHWTPTLHVDVASDADWRYQQLSRLLESSGIQVVRRDTIAPGTNSPQPSPPNTRPARTGSTTSGRMTR